MHPTVLKATNLTKKFTNPTTIDVLSGVNLEAKAGETIAIGGRSGEGKSTLLQILGTLDTPTTGTLEILNNPISSLNRSSIRNRHIGFIFQAFYLLSDFSALDNVLMPAQIARQNISEGSEARERAKELLNSMGLGSRLHHSSKLLSGGERQRVAIARALMNNPDLLFADEPTGNLDKQTAHEIYNILFETGKTLIIVTHDPALMSLCQKQYALNAGKLERKQHHA